MIRELSPYLVEALAILVVSYHHSRNEVASSWGEEPACQLVVAIGTKIIVQRHTKLEYDWSFHLPITE